MSVRAKMTCGYIDRGARGVSLNFSAVFEGSEELQAISENAIFGKATPSAFLNVVGPVDADRFVTNEEYYVDVADIAGGDPVPHETPILATAHAMIVYRSALDPNAPDRPVQFRYGLMAPHSGMLDMQIANPAAVAWLDAHDDIEVMIRLARGRRSDAEIAAIQKMLDGALADAGQMWDRVHAGGGDRYWAEDIKKVDRDTWIESRTPHLRQKLAVAKGEV